MVDLIFIDDCVVLTKSWVLHGLSKNKNVAPYNSISSFKTDISQFDLKTPVYIDSDLKDTMNGQEFAKELYDFGFKEIYLSTGHSPEMFPKMFWIKDVVGKMPPF